MIHLPLRRFLLPAFVFLLVIIIYRSTSQRFHAIPSFIIHHESDVQQGTRVTIGQTTPNSTLPAKDSHRLSSPTGLPSTVEDSHYDLWHGSAPNAAFSQPISENPSLARLWSCPRTPNKRTHHVRLPNVIQNVSLIPPKSTIPDSRKFWNPTIFALPPWSENPYLLVSRILTEGLHQENAVCQAYTCYGPAGKKSATGEERACTQDDVKILGSSGGLRCATAPMRLNVPPTPAKQCDGKHRDYVDIPGFHDPRIFWSGRGEPLMMINSHSRYACFGLWVTDLRPLYQPLDALLSNISAFSFGPSSQNRPTTPLLPYHPSPLASYPFVTELTRTPASSRAAMEKNWFLFFPSPFESYVHYDIADPSSPTRGRTFAKLLGSGLTTSNLTERTEISCFPDSLGDQGDQAIKGGKWHQSTNSLRLILCDRDDPSCIPGPDNTVLFAIIHKKVLNALKLPLRYERYAMVWSSTPPFSMIGISQHPKLFADETAPGWSSSQDQNDNEDTRNVPRDSRNKTVGTDQDRHTQDDPANVRTLWPGFTYTVSIAWAFRGPDSKTAHHSSAKTMEEEAGGKVLHSMQTGYWDDTVVLGIGVKDNGQAFARVKASDLLACLRACPGKEKDNVGVKPRPMK